MELIARYSNAGFEALSEGVMAFFDRRQDLQRPGVARGGLVHGEARDDRREQRLGALGVLALHELGHRQRGRAHPQLHAGRRRALAQLSAQCSATRS